MCLCCTGPLAEAHEKKLILTEMFLAGYPKVSRRGKEGSLLYLWVICAEWGCKKGKKNFGTYCCGSASYICSSTKLLLQFYFTSTDPLVTQVLQTLLGRCPELKKTSNLAVPLYLARSPSHACCVPILLEAGEQRMLLTHASCMPILLAAGEQCIFFKRGKR